MSPSSSAGEPGTCKCTNQSLSNSTSYPKRLTYQSRERGRSPLSTEKKLPSHDARLEPDPGGRGHSHSMVPGGFDVMS